MARIALAAACACLIALGAGWSGHRLSAAAPTLPQAVSLSPSAGTGAGRVFSFTYSDPDGASDIGLAEALIVSGTTVTANKSCYFLSSGDSLYLLDDVNSKWLGPVTAGGPEILSNAQCTVTAAGFSSSASGNSLTMTVPVTFQPSFAGAKTIYMKGTNRAGLSPDWVKTGAWTVFPLNPMLDVVTSSCGDASRDTSLRIRKDYEQGGRVSSQVVIPDCFPAYADWLPHEGYFMDGDRRPLPVMGRTCGHFNILMVFVDNDLNRRRLFENTTLPTTVRDKVGDGRIQDALTELFATYTPTTLWDGFVQRANVAKAVDFTISSVVTRLSSRDLDLTDGGLGFTNYDAVVVINDLTPISAHGVERWPGNLTRPLFYGKDGTFYLHIDPFWLQPALFAHEVLHRNVPWMLKEYQFGDKTLVLENGTTFERTPIINPRTGENIEPLVRAYEGKTPLAEYFAGYTDVDGDGIVDCMDPFITPTADNVDGDFLPDRLDPDLHFDHRPYSWMFASRTRPGAAAQGVLELLRRPGK